MTVLRSLPCLVVLIGSGCVLDAVPENTLAGTLRLTEERLALLEAVQPVPPEESPTDRFRVDLECQDGAQVIVSSASLDKTGVGAFEVVIPPAAEPTPWSCSFSAPGSIEVDCVTGQCAVDTRFALGTLRACVERQEGLLFSWDGDSRWLDDVVADGYDACVDLEKSSVPIIDIDRYETVPVSGECGDFIIWDRRLPHGNGRNTADRPRISQYITMWPASVDEQSRAARVAQFEQGMEKPMTGTTGTFELTALGRKLVGVDPWA